MTHIFWFTAKSGTGKTTITKKVEKALEKDFPVKVLDGDEIVSDLGGTDFRNKKYDEFITKAVKLITELTIKNQIILVAITCPKEHQRNYVRQVLGNTYHEIFLRCSKTILVKRRALRKSKRVELMGESRRSSFSQRLVSKIKKYYSLRWAYKNSYEVPLSPDVIIDTENKTVDVLVNTTLSYIHSIVSEEIKN